MSVTTPEPSDHEQGPPAGVHVAGVQADVQAQVEHHAPCVPDCPVCYPEGKDR